MYVCMYVYEPITLQNVVCLGDKFNRPCSSSGHFLKKSEVKLNNKWQKKRKGKKRIDPKLWLMLAVWNALDFKLYNRTRHKRHSKGWRTTALQFDIAHPVYSTTTVRSIDLHKSTGCRAPKAQGTLVTLVTRALGISVSLIEVFYPIYICQ